MEGKSGKFVVEVSNERLTDGSPYERWELDDETALADRLESELGWKRFEAELATSEVVSGRDFDDTDEETGKRVHAYKEHEVVA